MLFKYYLVQQERVNVSSPSTEVHTVLSVFYILACFLIHIHSEIKVMFQHTRHYKQSAVKTASVKATVLKQD